MQVAESIVKVQNPAGKGAVMPQSPAKDAGSGQSKGILRACPRWIGTDADQMPVARHRS
ncbi:hypothetical protein MES4922_40248 [Mesorhizobium ventifaucium]|uniref:Uncharacterized protein n=1 Tax=Mesorhizobium ventifaucium TaxID=666020 RepID=A0ABM9E8F6_9HYPH|nr:hypothetical protein MES4922_40248 [Mesorhizobium ventifaucium]